MLDVLKDMIGAGIVTSISLVIWSFKVQNFYVIRSRYGVYLLILGSFAGPFIKSETYLKGLKSILNIPQSEYILPPKILKQPARQYYLYDYYRNEFVTKTF